MDEREEGEISLEDVSSSEEANHNSWMRKPKKKEIDRKYTKQVEVDILPQDAVYGKENRQFSNELHTPEPQKKPLAPFEDLKDALFTPISSDEDIEIVSLPGSNEQMLLRLGSKRRKKKKKKKNKPLGSRMITKEDLESTVDYAPLPDRITGDVAIPSFDDTSFVDRNHRYDDSSSVMASTDRHESVLTRDRHDPVLARDRYDTHEATHRKYSPTSGKLYRSPTKHFKSPSRHSRSPSPRRRLSPRRISPVRTTLAERHAQHKSAKDLSDSFHAKNASLLKKVRQLGTGVSKSNKHQETSLKEKLFNKQKLDFKADDDYTYDHENKYKKEDEEDEDEEELRRHALETKLQKSDRSKDVNDEIKQESDDNSLSAVNYNVGDQDEEDLKLRMEALRSAVMNKHHHRVKRGVGIKKKIGSEKISSPSNDSLIDDIINDAYDEIGQTAPRASAGIPDSFNAEDMDLDSDLEREKENAPYSPTDYLSDDEINDGELENMLCLEPINAPINELYPHQNHQPSNPAIEMSGDDAYLRSEQFNYTASYLKPAQTEIHSRANTPYSPTDTPVLDPELPVCPSELSFSDNPVANSAVPHPSSTFLPRNLAFQPFNDMRSFIPSPMQISNPQRVPPPPLPPHFGRDPRDPRDPRRATNLVANYNNSRPQAHKLTPVVAEQTSEISLKTAERRLVDPRVNKPSTYIPSKPKPDERYAEIVESLENFIGEDLYAKDTLVITKNKDKTSIPVHRTLVPVTILKTNREFQQKLPNKKLDKVTEKTFAEMQPIEVGSEQQSKSNSCQPIKIQPQVRKIQLIPLPTKGFGGASAETNAEIIEHLTSVAKKEEPKKRGRGRPKTPTSKKTSKTKTPNRDDYSDKDGNGSGKKTCTRNSAKRSSRLNDDIEGGKGKKTNDAEVHSDEVVRRPRGRPRSVHREDDRSKVGVESGGQQKRESISRAAKAKASKTADISPKYKRVDDKKRRYSIDEDEEELRATLLASLQKKPKQTDKLVDKRQNEQAKHSTTNDKTKNSQQNSNNVLLHAANTALLNDKQEVSNVRVAINPLLASKRRSAATEIQGPPEKMYKKTPKELQKINSQSATSPVSPKMLAKKQPRLVINLGEDSDDSESDSFESARLAAGPSGCSSTTVKTGVDTNTSDFTRKVEEFLKVQRQQHETTISSTSTPISNKSTTAAKKAAEECMNVTPLAVRLLPASKQKEYRELKKQLEEKVKEKESGKVSKSTKAITSSKSIDKDPIASTSSIDVQELSTNNIPKSTLPSDNAPSPIPSVTETSYQQQSTLPLDYSVIKSDPNGSDEQKVDPALIESVSQACLDEINRNVSREGLTIKDKLVIQIQNTRAEGVPNYRHVRVCRKDETIPSEKLPSPAPPVLRILTTAQLNMKFEQDQDYPSGPDDQQVEKLVPLDKSIQIIAQEMANDQGINCDNNSINNVASIIPKPEPVCDSSELPSLTIASVRSVQIAPEAVNRDLLPGDQGDSTINLAEKSINRTITVEYSVAGEQNKRMDERIAVADKIKNETEKELETYMKLPANDQSVELPKMENELVKKRYNVLTDLSEMADNLQQWEIERDLQLKLAEEERQLKLQLRAIEKRLEEQRARINEMNSKITKAHSTINSGRADCLRLTKLCQAIGANVAGNEYKVPDLGAEVLMEKLKEVASHTRKLSNKRVSQTDSNKEQANNNDADQSPVTSTSKENNSYDASMQQTTPLNLSVQNNKTNNTDNNEVKKEKGQKEVSGKDNEVPPKIKHEPLGTNEATATPTNTNQDSIVGVKTEDSANDVNSEQTNDRNAEKSSSAVNNTIVLDNTLNNTSVKTEDDEDERLHELIGGDIPLIKDSVQDKYRQNIDDGSVTPRVPIGERASYRYQNSDGLTSPLLQNGIRTTYLPNISDGCTTPLVNSGASGLSYMQQISDGCATPLIRNSEISDEYMIPLITNRQNDTSIATKTTSNNSVDLPIHPTPNSQNASENVADQDSNNPFKLPGNVRIKVEKLDDCDLSVQVISSQDNLNNQRKSDGEVNTEHGMITQIKEEPKAVDVNNEGSLENPMLVSEEQLQSVSTVFNDGRNEMKEKSLHKEQTLENENVDNNVKKTVRQTSERSADIAQDIAGDNNGNDDGETRVVNGVNYESVLTAFKTPRPLDPNGVLCPYELMGTCMDDSCKYNHLDTNRKT